MDLNKIPRGVLVVVAFVGIGATNILISTARADLDKFKSIAYQAKNVSDANTQSISELKNAVSDVRSAQETFRREYREDQKDLDKKLADIAKAVKA